MKILFVHQNFPGQFRHLAPALAAQGHEVHALTLRDLRAPQWQKVRLHRYPVKRSSTAGVHPWLKDFETKTIRGEACFFKARELAANGFEPDIIIAAHGWGESLFLKDVWPKAKLGIYCEFYYRTEGADLGFDPEFAKPEDNVAPRVRLKNLHNELQFPSADAGLSPTQWQADGFPPSFRDKISVVHEGIDTRGLAPAPNAKFQLPSGKTLTKADEVVTFVNRNLEPYRGYHIFMRSLPRLLKARPKAQIVIVGGDSVSYGASRTDGRSWKDALIDEVRPQLTDNQWERVHFVGNLPYEHYQSALQISSVHVYLTYPFVLSWSLLEAMSMGCAIVASDTAPVREVIASGETGELVDFFDTDRLADTVAALLADPERQTRLGLAARSFAVDRYDLATRCLPAQLKWVEALANPIPTQSRKAKKSR